MIKLDWFDGTVDGCEIQESHHEMKPLWKPLFVGITGASNHSRVPEVVENFVHPQ